MRLKLEVQNLPLLEKCPYLKFFWSNSNMVQYGVHFTQCILKADSDTNSFLRISSHVYFYKDSAVMCFYWRIRSHVLIWENTGQTEPVF